jgi:SlyX protein
MGDPVNDRIEDLEAKLTFQDDTLQKLSDAMVQQQARMDHLEASLKWLVESRQQASNDLDGTEDSPPPHY